MRGGIMKNPHHGKRHFNLPVTGDLSKERWPKYVIRRDKLIYHVMAAFGSCGFLFKEHRHSPYVDHLQRFFIGDDSRSRLLAICPHDPGVVYVMKDDNSNYFIEGLFGGGRRVPQSHEAVAAYTLGYLTDRDYAIIECEKEFELEKYRNLRLHFCHRM